MHHLHQPFLRTYARTGLRSKGQTLSATGSSSHTSTGDPHHSSAGQLLSLSQIDDVHVLDLDSVATKTIMQHLETMAHHCYTLGSPRTDLLLHLIQLNLTKSLMENTRILGLTSEDLHDDALSPFNTAGPWPYNFGFDEQSLPPSLRPTQIQRTVPHHPWLDLLPAPQMRDNLIHAGESFDEERLCRDIKGWGSVRTGNTGIIVWKDPWDAAGWEVSEAFARNWGWVLWGCEDLFRSTNYWRAQRGERPLFRTSNQT